MKNLSISERTRRTYPVAPEDYAAPFEELTAAAGKFKNFTDGDPQMMREALSNVRGIKRRAMHALDTVTTLHKKHTALDEAMRLLTDLVYDMDAIERKITDGMIDGRNAA